MRELDYRASVIELGDDASEMLYQACKYTWPNREGKYGEILADVDHFRGSRSWSDAPLLEMPSPEGLINSAEVDGIGTKIKVTQMTSRYDTAADDLIAMAADDAAAKGFEPAVFVTALAVNRLNDRLTPYAEALARGAVRAAARARIALFGGETAILGNMIGGYGNPEFRLHFDWTATVIAKAHRERLIDGRAIEPGMSLVGFREPGFRSNGITKVRDTAREAFGRRWHDRKFDFGYGPERLGDAVLKGSVIYTPALVDASGGMDLRVLPQAKLAGAAHITGGGVWGKLGDLLAVSGYGADISDPYPVPEPMKLIQKAADMTDRDLYGSFHGGQGMIAATPEADELIDCAERNGVEAKVIGEVTKAPEIIMRSQGRAKGRKLAYPLAA